MYFRGFSLTFILIFLFVFSQLFGTLSAWTPHFSITNHLLSRFLSLLFKILSSSCFILYGLLIYGEGVTFRQKILLLGTFLGFWGDVILTLPWTNTLTFFSGAFVFGIGHFFFIIHFLSDCKFSYCYKTLLSVLTLGTCFLAYFFAIYPKFDNTLMKIFVTIYMIWVSSTGALSWIPRWEYPYFIFRATGAITFVASDFCIGVGRWIVGDSETVLRTIFGGQLCVSLYLTAQFLLIMSLKTIPREKYEKQKKRQKRRKRETDALLSVEKYLSNSL